MSRIPTITEQQLGNLKPTGLDGDFLTRLTACAEGTHGLLSEEETAFEASLRAIRPRKIPAGLSASLLDALGDTAFSVEDKIVLFNKPTTIVAAGKARNGFRFNIAAAAAAVAMLGAIAAFIVPAQPAENRSANTGNNTAGHPVPSPAAPSLVAPVGFIRNLSGTRDEGVVWRGRNQPHRVLRLTYTDQMTVMDTDGNPVRIEKPRVEYVIIPERID
jgi:hypothetical protein